MAPAIEGYPTQGDLVLARLVVEGYLIPGAWGPWQIIEPTTGLIIGGVGFKGAPDDDGRVEIAYSLASSARGYGYATEAVNGLLEWSRGQGVRQVTAECDESNVASAGVLDRCGFSPCEHVAGAIIYRCDLTRA